MSGDDDLFASLGGSLMKDLLADLAVDEGEGWMSLDELERELAHLDQGPKASSLSTVPEASTSAASMVVANQTRGSVQPTRTADINNPAVDAWSLSFQKFSAASLEQDFLQADSARKQQQQPATALSSPPPGLPPGLDLTTIKDYNVDEAAKVRPSAPPGLPTNKSQTGEQNLSEAASKLMEQLQHQLADAAQADVDPTPVKADAPPPPAADEQIPPPSFPIPRPAVPRTPQNSMTLDATGTPILMSGAAGTPRPYNAPTPQLTGHPMATGMVALPPVMTGPPVIPLASIPVAVPLARPTGAWQSPPPPAPRPPPRPVYCDPHPRARPVPAATLASQYMTPRDIGFVVHGILRHLQTAGASTIDDYDVQYWVRRNGAAAEQDVLHKHKNDDVVSTPVQKREVKSQQWSHEKQTLGYVAKSSVARPRAVLAQVTPETSSNSESSKQRAALWKSRIYVDQAYQAFTKVVLLIKNQPPDHIAQIQPYIRKLLKCMGLEKTRDEGDQNMYTIVDEEAMKLLLKLDKGKVLMSRILEQALLPPKAFPTALPLILRVLCEKTSGDTDDEGESRLFSNLARVTQTLPEMPSESVLESLQTVQKFGPRALATTARMQCVHSLLQRGSKIASSDTTFQKDWTSVEEAFMKLLAEL